MAVPDLAAELGRIPLFAELAPASLDALGRVAHVRRLARGQVLFTEGEPSDYLFLVRSGRLRVVVSSPRGEELVLSVVGPGGMRRLSGTAADLVFLDLPRRLAKLLLVESRCALTARPRVSWR